MAEASAGGSMSSGAVKELQTSISKMVEDMGKLTKLSDTFAKNMRSANQQTNRRGWGRGGGGGFSTQSVNAGGYGASTGDPGGEITDTGSMNRGPGYGRQALGVVGKTAIGMGIGAINDLRPSAEEAVNWEWLSRRARYATGDYSRFRGNITGQMPAYGIMNKELYMGDVAEALHMGGGYSMGIGVGGQTAGERLAAANIGSFHAIAAMNGLDASTAQSAYASIYSPQTYYKAQAAGVMTRDASGRQLSVEEIANQYTARFGTEELQKQLSYGETGWYEMVSTHGEVGAEYIISAIRERTRLAQAEGNPNRMLKAGEMTSASVWEATGAAGGPETQGLDSKSRLHGAEINKLAEYQQDTTKGVAFANTQMATLNQNLADLEGAARAAAGAVATAGGALDAFATTMPETYGAAMSGLSALGGVGLGAMLGRGGRGGRGGGGAGGGMGARALGGAARLGVGGLGAYGLYNATQYRSSQTGQGNWSTGDTLRTVGQSAASGALLGGAIGSFIPGVGTVIGAGVGGVLGGIYGGWQSWMGERDEGSSRSSYNSPSFASGKWEVEKDEMAHIHQGEMILPSRIAQAVRSESAATKGNGSGTRVYINLTIQNATDQQAIAFASRVKTIIEEDREMMVAGEGLLR